MSFSEFLESRERSEIAEDTNFAGALPVTLAFQRKQVFRFADGRVVGKYREVRTGVEIIFPSQFTN